MRLGRLLADPWTILAGGAIAAASAAVMPVAPAVAIGLGGYAVGTAVKAMTSRGERPDDSEPGVELPPPGTDARVLYDRARDAVGELDEIARAQRPGPLREQSVDVQVRAGETLADVARLAGQTVILARALGRVDVPQAQRDLARLEQLQADEGATSASTSSLEAVRSQLAVAARLQTAWRDTHQRLLSAALGLESLVASMAEVAAMSSAAGEGDAGTRIRHLADGLTGLREGLAEAEAASRRALSA